MRRLSPEARYGKRSAVSPSTSTSLSLHLDDISEQGRSTRDVHESAASPDSENRSDMPSSPFHQKTKEHIKLFKQYLSTCKKNGANCALDAESSSDSSESGDDPARHPHRRSSLNTSRRASGKMDSFLTRQRSLSLTGPLFCDASRSNDSGASRTPSHTSAASRSDSPALSWKAPPSASAQEPQLGAQGPGKDQAADSVYRSQVAVALGAGRAVWL